MFRLQLTARLRARPRLHRRSNPLGRCRLLIRLCRLLRISHRRSPFARRLKAVISGVARCSRLHRCQLTRTTSRLGPCKPSIHDLLTLTHRRPCHCRRRRPRRTRLRPLLSCRRRPNSTLISCLCHPVLGRARGRPPPLCRPPSAGVVSSSLPSPSPAHLPRLCSSPLRLPRRPPGCLRPPRPR